MPGVKFELADHGWAVKMTLPAAAVPGAATIKLELDAEAIDALLRDLGRLRQQLPVEQPRELDTSGLMYGVLDPAWRLNREVMAGYAILSLRHPGFGWLSFALPHLWANTIGRMLVAQGQEPGPAVPERKN